MPLVSAALCPHPTMLIPEFAGAEVDESRRLRAACFQAVRQLEMPIWPGDRRVSANAPHLVVIVGGDTTTREFDPEGAYGQIDVPNGMPWTFGWGQAADHPQPLPAPLTVGHWLTIKSRPDEAGAILCDFIFQSVDVDATPDECFELGRALSGRAKRVSMLVMGECLGRDHTGALHELDPTAFGPSDPGRSAWQVLVGAAERQTFQARSLLEAPWHVVNWTAGV